jgi:preprotein translocase subunit SecA
VAILPVYLNALPGKGVHLVTVNDYLAKRDCDWMRPVYEYLGMTCGAIQSNMDNDERKAIYNGDITYGTNNEFGFDYLRDNMVVEAEQMVQREHWYAIVDEVDSVLIDEARTPLIISGPVGNPDQKFEEMEPRVRKLVEAQMRNVNQYVSEAESLLKKGTKEAKDEAGILILMSHRAMPKHKRLLKLMQDPELQKLKAETELFYLREQGRKMAEIDEKLLYSIDEKHHSIDISEKGRQLLCTHQEDPEMFVIPDIATELSAIEGDTDLPEKEKQLKKDRVHLLYAERSDRIHTVTQLLRAFSLYERDIEYVIQNGKIMIVDEFTGRILDGRRYSDGLHQAIEAKEHVKVERDTQTFATVTLQNYFRLYHKLGGMTGTAETEAAEFEKIYKLEVVVIPTNRPIQRKDDEDLIFKTKREKYNAIIDHVEELLKEGRPVLVGTASVEVSEILSKMLQRKKVPHNVLNAKAHAKEAEIVAAAGKKGAVTIATNMAGRGTDIKINDEIKKNGGLAIIGSERHDARRIDRQLRGRSGRQGDPGTSIFYISLEDNLMRLFSGDRVAGVMSKLDIPEGEPISHSMITKAVERAQKKVEENNFAIRKRLLEYDDVMNQQREVIYNRRKAALRGERLKGELFDYIDEMASEWFQTYQPNNEFDEFMNDVRTTLLCEPNITREEFKTISEEAVVQRVVEAAEMFYTRKEEMIGTEFLSKLERVAVLQTIDDKWREHLRQMDDLKEGIHLRSYGQKDPLMEYKKEAFELFVSLIREINKQSVNFSFKFFPQIIYRDQDGNIVPPPEENAQIPTVKRAAPRKLSFRRDEAGIPAPRQEMPQAQAPAEAQAGEAKVQTHVREEPKIGRNDPCPCGSGKKYKKCCGIGEDSTDL